MTLNDKQVSVLIINKLTQKPNLTLQQLVVELAHCQTDDRYQISCVAQDMVEDGRLEVTSDFGLFVPLKKKD